MARDAIIDAAESLFGLHGIDRVSLRQISGAAGCANNVAVQYHFGDREGLIRAVFEKRLPAIEQLREVMLADAETSDRLGDPRTLAAILFRPSVDLIDAHGVRSYAAFLLSLSFSQEGLGGRFGAVSDLAPIARRAAALLVEALPDIPRDLLIRRIALAPAMFIGSVGHLLRGTPQLAEELLIDDALDMLTAAISAPASPSLIAAVESLPDGQIG